jgi:hypothetical protein
MVNNHGCEILLRYRMKAISAQDVFRNTSTSRNLIAQPPQRHSRTEGFLQQIRMRNDVAQ